MASGISPPGWKTTQIRTILSNAKLAQLPPEGPFDSWIKEHQGWDGVNYKGRCAESLRLV